MVMMVMSMLMAVTFVLFVMVMMVFVYHDAIHFPSAKVRRPACNRVAKVVENG